jgi:hypothetical protein
MALDGDVVQGRIEGCGHGRTRPDTGQDHFFGGRAVVLATVVGVFVHGEVELAGGCLDGRVLLQLDARSEDRPHPPLFLCLGDGLLHHLLERIRSFDDSSRPRYRPFPSQARSSSTPRYHDRSPVLLVPLIVGLLVAVFPIVFVLLQPRG